MAVSQATRHHGSNLLHAVVVLTLSLGLALTGFVIGALAANGAHNLLSSEAPPQPPTRAQGSGAPAAPDPSQAASPAGTPTPTSTPTLSPGSGKVIVVSIADQRLTAYDNGQVFLTTVVATGRPELPTPVGTFHVQSKASPYKFVSPWPKGDPYWYPTEWVSYAMLFADDGYFIHDAPWRTVWGPGANLTQGSHGCVNVPKAAMAALYAWAEVGTTVVIQ